MGWAGTYPDRGSPPYSVSAPQHLGHPPQARAAAVGPSPQNPGVATPRPPGSPCSVSAPNTLVTTKLHLRWAVGSGQWQDSPLLRRPCMVGYARTRRFPTRCGFKPVPVHAAACACAPVHPKAHHCRRLATHAFCIGNVCDAATAHHPVPRGKTHIHVYEPLMLAHHGLRGVRRTKSQTTHMAAGHVRTHVRMRWH